MKKILIVALIIIAAFGASHFLPDYSAGKSYPLNTVSSAAHAGAAALGGVLEEQRTVSGSLRGAGAFGRIGAWFRAVTGQKELADMDELLVRRGPDKVTITSLHRFGVVHELQISPSPNTSKFSADLEGEILKILPGVKVRP